MITNPVDCDYKNFGDGALELLVIKSLSDYKNFGDGALVVLVIMPPEAAKPCGARSLAFAARVIDRLWGGGSSELVIIAMPYSPSSRSLEN